MSLPTDNLILRTDSNKASHLLQFPKETWRNVARNLDGRLPRADTGHAGRLCRPSAERAPDGRVDRRSWASLGRVCPYLTDPKGSLSSRFTGEYR